MLASRGVAARRSEVRAPGLPLEGAGAEWVHVACQRPPRQDAGGIWSQARTALADMNERVEEIEELFEQNDTDGNGDIDFSEFSALMKELDAQMPQTALEAGFREIDANKDGRINLDEFLVWWLDD
jgi:hypothetical protein